ncbi:hypothetical protein F2Q69_00007605 [Brassica cretica]|uniref:Uncharacterized protein n=1 Tax=Brassica cretica TaxID=69181 RepID=A0A8S9PIE8_BRACR|nr:hypothetical protein F2Q69_00007605 [Brassica cretica]
MLVVTNRRCRIDCRCGTTFPWRIILVQLWFFCTMTVRKKLDRCDVYLMTLGEKTVAEERECSKEDTMTVRKKPDRCDVYLMTVGEKTVVEERECSKEE